MVRKLIGWALENPIVVILLAVFLAIIGVFSFLNVNVEVYPDPAPAIVEVIALFPGASAEEVERQVTVPLEVTFAGMPGLKKINSKSLFGLSDLKMTWHYGNAYTYETARQEVINRMSTISQPLPSGVTPAISPESPTGEIFRYVLKVPKDASGRELYTLNDIKAMQDWVLEREFRRVPRIVDVTSFGGTVRRYEVQPDPDRLRRYGITLGQLQATLTNSNATVGGDYINPGQVAMTVRSVGLFGGALDPVNKVLGLKSPAAAATILRAEELRRIREIRSLVISSVNNQPIRVDDVVEGGRLSPGQLPGEQGVVVSHQTRLGRIGYWRADRERPPRSPLSIADVGHDEDDRVTCIVLLRKGEDTLPALKDVKAKVQQLNEPTSGRLLPGTKIETYYDRTDLLNITTDTVTENLLTGVALVVIILFMFVNNIKTAIIVAINIPLALLFAFTMLYVRGKSANLLSIGAVDFGIIVDSSVVVVENIYRNLAAHNYPDLPMKERILRFVKEIDHALMYSVLIMVCAFVPLFAMTGPEGALFGPMAQTYAFSLAGALVLSLTLTPVLCMLLFKRFKPVEENFLVRALKFRYLWKLQLCLRYPKTTCAVMAFLIGGTACLVPQLGREFMPELEEGNLWLRGIGPLNMNLDHQAAIAKQARAIIARFPEVESIVTQSGRPDDGTDTEGFYSGEYFVPLRPQKDWPRLVPQTGWRRWIWGSTRARTKREIVFAMNADLERVIPGVVWNFSQSIRDNVLEALSGVKGDNSLKIFGPDFDQLELRAAKAKNILQEIKGVANVGVFHVRGSSHLEFRVDPEKCQKWGVTTADVNNVVSSAVGAKAMSSMVEGEKLFDISTRWPKWRRTDETSILDIPVDIINNQVVLAQGSGFTPTASGNALPPPAISGSLADTSNPISSTPRIRLGDLVTPVGADYAPDPNGHFYRAGASTIYREQGKRFIAIKFSVRERDLGSAVDEAKARTKDLFKSPYEGVWSGEFEQMEEANGRLMWIIPLSLALIFILLYAAFRSFLDTIVIFSNVFDVAVGGVWSLYLTGTNFSVSAAVGFVSLFGIAIMEGLLLISYFNALRIQGLPVHDAIVQGSLKRVRPVMITAMTAILGLLPAAVSTKMGSQTAKPLAIVVVGGMAVTLLLDRYLMPVLYSFYGHREPPEGGGGMAH
ncbi:efflux RND transporter permease subunit [Singulisphaera acidiphila]|uniref:Putative silver efflux pump n=1 Tax=Singulisphaera acidiphila (strain ATCC BAA-1392 / DSM 18658 / VKM B-2454 / MOB10) TaxID=886293 RepID=L0DEH7_SINAD|nr:efflux RND transporter permease subunit [Singulisphaera acidiphila]AGA27228.1 putative silver efflux pump [Singulisphaera acidiphila DSM 18658]